MSHTRLFPLQLGRFVKFCWDEPVCCRIMAFFVKQYRVL